MIYFESSAIFFTLNTEVISPTPLTFIERALRNTFEYTYWEAPTLHYRLNYPPFHLKRSFVKSMLRSMDSTTSVFTRRSIRFIPKAQRESILFVYLSLLIQQLIIMAKMSAAKLVNFIIKSKCDDAVAYTPTMKAKVSTPASNKFIVLLSVSTGRLHPRKTPTWREQHKKISSILSSI